MTLRSSDLQSDSDMDSIRNSCDVFNWGHYVHFIGNSCDGLQRKTFVDGKIQKLTIIQSSLCAGVWQKVENIRNPRLSDKAMASHRNPFVANQKYFLWIVGKSELGIQFISSEKTPDEDLFCLQGGNYQSIRQGLNV